MKKNKRLYALDALKAIAVVAMVILHVIVWWFVVADYGASNPSQEFHDIVILLEILGFVSITIPMTAGAAFYLYFSKEKNKWSLVRKSAYLILLGYLSTVVAFGIESIESWDVLQFIGLSLLLLVLLSRFSLTVIFLVSSLMLIISPYVRELASPLPYYIGVILAGDGSGWHYWPLFPWFAGIGFGYVLMGMYKQGLLKKYQRWVVVSCLVIITLAHSVGKLLVNPDLTNFYGDPVFYPSPWTAAARFCGFVLLFLLLVTLDVKKERKYGVVSALSKGILWIYITNIVVGFRLIEYLKQFVVVSHFSIFLTALGMLIFAYVVGVLTIKGREVKKQLS